jgi:hypothetical protein
MLPRGELPGLLGMLSGLGSQRPTLLGDALVYSGDIQLDLATASAKSASCSRSA